MIGSPRRTLITWPCSAAAAVQFTCSATAAVGMRLRIAVAFGIVFPDHIACVRHETVCLYIMYVCRSAGFTLYVMKWGSPPSSLSLSLA